MTTASTAPLAEDLAPLAPRRSPLRNGVLAGLAVLVLIGTWFSPAIFRPALVQNAQGGTGAVLHDSLVVVSMIQPEAWPSASLERIEDVPGAQVEGAWVFDGETSAVAEEVSSSSDPLTFLSENYPGTEFAPGGNLPVTIRSGERRMLAVIWRVTSCTEFLRGAAQSELSAFASESDDPQAILRSPLGTPSRATLGELGHPYFYMSEDLYSPEDLRSCDGAS